MNGSKTFAYLFVITAAVLLLLAVYKTFISPTSKQPGLPTKESASEKAVEKLVPPTLSPQEREIVANIETLKVDINNTAVSPAVLTVKQHDQVAFFNSSSKTIKVDGGSWGKVPLSPGENMTQSFKDLGTFDYTVPELNLKGQVVVK